jgi:Mg2+ and Co2+ transporter CorA
MIMKWYLLNSGRLEEEPPQDGWPIMNTGQPGENWFDIVETNPEELRSFLNHLDLHPVQLAHCLDSINDPGVISFGKTLLMEYPTVFNAGSDDPSYLSLIIVGSFLVTIRHGPTPSLDELIFELTNEKATPLRHLPQIVYLILDQFADLNVEAQIEIRDKILGIANKLAENPNSVNANELSRLRWQVDKLVSLIENQLFCVSGLNASDNIALQEPHRKAYLQDLVSEAEIAQRGVYRLENRVNSLYNDYQMAGSDRVEKRLRFLTIVSVITLPLGLIAGLLGMNVGGLPATSFRYGFLIVVVVMIVIGLFQYWYFKRNGWFD